jgi:hypothetical protein
MPVMAEQDTPRSAKRVRKGYNVNVWIDSVLGAAAEHFLEQHEPRTDKTGLVEVALKKFLTDCGFYPPPPASDQ